MTSFISMKIWRKKSFYPNNLVSYIAPYTSHSCWRAAPIRRIEFTSTSFGSPRLPFETKADFWTYRKHHMLKKRPTKTKASLTSIQPFYPHSTHCCVASHAVSGSTKLDGLKITQQFFLPCSHFISHSLALKWISKNRLFNVGARTYPLRVSSKREEAIFRCSAFSMVLRASCAMTFILYQGNRRKCSSVNFYFQFMVFGGNSFRRWIHLGSHAYFLRFAEHHLNY